MNIVYAATRNLYPHMLPTITSLLEHNTPSMIYVLAEDDELPFDIPAPHEIINVSGQTVFPADGPNYRSMFTYMAMMRICYVDLLPVDKVIQLDIDTIVCDSLLPIWETDMTGKWFSACEEIYARYKPFGKRYYNIGVCLFNLQQMRADNIVPTMVKELNANYHLCLEQDMLNLYGVPAHVVPMERRFNECRMCGYTDHPAVVHYAGYTDWFRNPLMDRAEYLLEYKRREAKS